MKYKKLTVPFLFLCTRAFHYVPYSFLLISNKFCVYVYCTVYNLTALPPSRPPTSYGPWKLLGAQVHKTIYGPLIDTALYVMFLNWANLFLVPL